MDSTEFRRQSSRADVDVASIATGVLLTWRCSGSSPFAFSWLKRIWDSFSITLASAGKLAWVRMSASRETTRQSQRPFARIVAVLLAAAGFLHIAAISPKTEPDGSVATTNSPTTTSTSPWCSTYILSPWLPSKNITSLSWKISFVACSLNTSRKTGRQPLKMSTCFKHSMLNTARPFLICVLLPSNLMAPPSDPGDQDARTVGDRGVPRLSAGAPPRMPACVPNGRGLTV
mmetsp:Transcript_26404/g.79578  ORF Transcript_26404/g.79578 Transcript_26404/m.79578 type:complete len:231 (-) Transcript_26404:24-716(-)